MNNQLFFIYRFVQSWSVRNNGEEAWPYGCYIKSTSNENLPVVPVEPIEPGQCTVISVNLRSPCELGSFQTKWRLFTSNGSCFGGKYSNYSIFLFEFSVYIQFICGLLNCYWIILLTTTMNTKCTIDSSHATIVIAIWFLLYRSTSNNCNRYCCCWLWGSWLRHVFIFINCWHWWNTIEARRTEVAQFFNRHYCKQMKQPNIPLFFSKQSNHTCFHYAD